VVYVTFHRNKPVSSGMSSKLHKIPFTYTRPEVHCIQIVAFWGLTPCSHVHGYRRLKNSKLLRNVDIHAKLQSSQKTPLDPILSQKNPVHILSRHCKKQKIIVEETLLYLKTRDPSCVEKYFPKVQDPITCRRWKSVLRD
jgi:hypothetical protein